MTDFLTHLRAGPDGRYDVGPDVFVALAGVWLVVTPVVAESRAGYPGWNDFVTGLVLATLAVVRVLRPRGLAILGVVNTVLGGWLVAAPFALGYAGTLGVAWNDVIVGTLVVMLAGVGALTGAGEALTRSRATGPDRTR